MVESITRRSVQLLKGSAAGLALAGVLSAAGCGGQRTLEEVQSLEYMKSREGKTLVYPEDVDAPPQSSAYAIPPASPDSAAQDYDVNELARPPRLFERQGADDEEEDGGEADAE